MKQYFWHSYIGLLCTLIVIVPLACLATTTWQPKPDVTLTIFDKPHAVRYELDGKKYVIDLDACVMTDGETSLRFSEEEAARIHGLLGIVGKYVADSDAWFKDPELRKKYWQEQKQSDQARRNAE